MAYLSDRKLNFEQLKVTRIEIENKHVEISIAKEQIGFGFECNGAQGTAEEGRRTVGDDRSLEASKRTAQVEAQDHMQETHGQCGHVAVFVHQREDSAG